MLNSLYRDVAEGEKYEGYGLQHSAEVICDELIELKEYAEKTLPDVDLSTLNIRNSSGAFGDRGFMQHVKTKIRKMANMLEIDFELDQNIEQPKTVLNLIQNQNVTQVNSQVFENVISNINKLDLDVDIKKEILEDVNNFKNESINDNPDTNKLKKLFRSIWDKSKEAAAMLSYWATISGVMNLLTG